MKYISEIKNENIDKIKYLVIEQDKNDTNGFFIYLHESLDLPCKFDGWYLTIEEAFDSAFEEFGVNLQDWKLTNEEFNH